MLKLLVLLASLFLAINLLAQNSIQTKKELGVEDLLKNVFIKGNCKNVRNISAIGNESLSIGQFENGANIINLSEGIILSTGDFNLAQGPNVDNESGFAFNTEFEDADLSQLATDKLFDVTAIEFDFVPLDDHVTFRYVFASEEYCEFVTTSFNDVFGFFVSGPGINGSFDNNAINVATLNASNENVSINTVNHLDNTNFYISNVTTIDAENCEINYSPLFQDLIEYDGFTIPLTASFEVIPCETYHIRLVIGDVGDANLDSAVFLEAKSFDLGEKVNIRAEVPGRMEPVAYESCVDGQYVFTRNDLNSLNEECTVEFSISPESKARNGIDFEEIPMRVTIPAGDTSVILPINFIEDNLTEGRESIKLEFVYDCECIDPVFSELFIDESNDLFLNIKDVVVCRDQAFMLIPEIIGGVPPLEFLWDTGLESNLLRDSISTSRDYTLMVTDFCGNTSFDQVEVRIQNTPTATLMGTFDLCDTGTTGIPVQLEGSPPWSIAYSIDGIAQEPIEDIQDNPFYIGIRGEGSYEITAFYDAFCEGNIVGNSLVEYSSFLVETAILPPSCPNSFDGSIALSKIEAVAPFSIIWNVESEDDFLINNLGEGIYTLKIIDAEGCQYEKTFNLEATSDKFEDCARIYIPNSFSPNNDGINDVFTLFFDSNSGVKNINSFQVFSRWGALVFEQNNFVPNRNNSGWKGDYKGRILNSGIYIYKIIVAFDNGVTKLFTGEISLLR